MLTLGRKLGQSIIIRTKEGETIEIAFININRKANWIRLAIKANKDFNIVRKEIDSLTPESEREKLYKEEITGGNQIQGQNKKHHRNDFNSRENRNNNSFIAENKNKISTPTVRFVRRKQINHAILKGGAEAENDNAKTSGELK